VEITENKHNFNDISLAIQFRVLSLFRWVLAFECINARPSTYRCLLPLNKQEAFEKMLGLFATTSRLTPIQQMSLTVLSRAACASMSTTTTTTTTRDRGDRYGPMEWAQQTANNWVRHLKLNNTSHMTQTENQTMRSL